MRLDMASDPSFVDLAYSSESLWMLMTSGEVVQHDVREGKAQHHALPSTGQPRAIWADSEGAIILAGNQMIGISDGTATVLRQVDAEFGTAIPVRDGYIGLPKSYNTGPAPPVVHVPDRGSRKVMPLVARAAAAPDPGSGEEPVTSEKQRIRWPDGRRGILAPLSLDEFAFVRGDPYEVHVLRLDGTAIHVCVDDGKVRRPEDSAALVRPGHRLLGVELVGIGRVLRHGDQLVVERRYRGSFELTQDLGLPVGTRVTGEIGLVDFIDLDTGQVTERVDVRALRPFSMWVGFRQDDLVLAAAPGSVVFASRGGAVPTTGETTSEPARVQ